MNRIVLGIITVLTCQLLAQQQEPITQGTAGVGCIGCDIFRHGDSNKIRCEKDHVILDHPNVKLARTLSMPWSSADSNVDWKVTFHRSPCGEKIFDANHSTCLIVDVPNGTYTYTVELKGCKRKGKGTITVISPNTK